RRDLRVRHRTGRRRRVEERGSAGHVRRSRSVGSVTGALDGVRVLDLGTRIGAPFAATLLAELGAEVIKIEQPGSGDFMRTIPPFDAGVSLWWAVDGRGKKSVTLDLSKERGQEILRRLVEHADVL